MKTPMLSRRNFMKASLAGLAWASLSPKEHAEASYKTPRYMLVGNKQGTSVHRKPDDSSLIMYQRQYNDIITVYDEIISPSGPDYNPIWYKCWGGYVFSGHLYEVKYEYNELSQPKYETGQLAEVTVPYTRSMYYTYNQGWDPMWLFYYKSTHWVTDVIEGPDGKPWYKVVDELGKTPTAVRPEHLRLIPDEEFEPISTDIPQGEKHIEISMMHQRLRAYEGNEIAFETKISTGSMTERGNFVVTGKYPSKHMGDAMLTSDVQRQIWMGVPWTVFFESEFGLAIHGTFWHMNYGTPMSGGCINMVPDEAKWIYRWTIPYASPERWFTPASGTRINVVA